MTTRHYDLIIIGAGAGGGTLAYSLAPTGKKILILERGDYIPREKDNWNPEKIFQGQKYQTTEEWLDGEDRVFSPEAFYRVGGNTKVYGAALQRMRVEDFGDVQHYDGISPAWELNYEDIEPYYVRAESLYKVHGQSGEDPTEPPMSAEFPHGAIAHEPRIQEVADSLKEKGLHPFHLTMAIDRDEENPHNRPCIKCDTCDPYPCLTDAKCDAQVTCVDPALQNGNVELKINALVTKLVTDASGQRVTEVEVVLDGTTQTFTADTFVVSCGAINSAALLLKSANEKHPHGLANSSGLVGRNLMLHNHSALISVSDKLNDTKFQKTLGFNDFYFKGSDGNYPLGQIQLTGKAKWNRLDIFSPDSVPRETLEYMASRSVDWWLTTEDLPRLKNRVTVNSAGKIKVDYEPNNLKPHAELISTWERYLREVGFFLFFAKKMPLRVVWHQGGTCKFGCDSQNSVLDLNCRTHDVENLYVVDASFIPSMGSVNPTLTIIANTLRVADHLKTTLGE